MPPTLPTPPTPLAVCLASLAMACVSCSSSHPAAPLAGGDAGADVGGPADAATPPRPVALVPPVASLPFDAAAVVVVSAGAPMDYEGALFEDTSRGSLAVVFERFLSEVELRAELRIAHAGSDGSFGASSRVEVSADALVAGPRALVRGGEAFLYFMHGDASQKRTRLSRSRLQDGAFEAPTDLVLADAFAGMLAWPCPADRGDGVVLAYDHYRQSQHVAIGDGASFRPPARIGDGVQSRVASMADGTLVATWQSGVESSMVVDVRVSADGVTWSPSAPITERANVHDASPFRRADGGVDVYYISPEGAPGFRILRRAVRADASLGPEEIVSSAAAGALVQPHPHRLHDGTIGLVFAAQITSNVDTDTCMARIAGDAPP